MNISHIDQNLTSSGDNSVVASGNRRDILLEIVSLQGELNLAKDKVTWIENRLAKSRQDLKNFDNQ